VKYSNEIKVGATIIFATVIFILGVRYFEDLPLFSSTYSLTSEFDKAGGLIAGNVVRINGVVVGSVNAVYIHPESQRVRVEFHVDKEIPVTEGSTAVITGFDALGVVRLDVILGAVDAARISEGGRVPGTDSADFLGGLADKAPELMNRVDDVLATLNSVLGQTGQLISEPDSDIRQTLVSVQSSAKTLDDFLTSERSRLSQILRNIESFSGDMSRFSSENADSLGTLVGNLNRTLKRLDQNLVSLESVSESLADVFQKINAGEGTLGLFVNDPGVYQKMDSVLTSVDALLNDFRINPDKYLKELRLVEIF